MHTASYKVFCWFSLASTFWICFLSSVNKAPRVLSSSFAAKYLALAWVNSIPYFSRCFSSSKMRFLNSCASAFHRAMSFWRFMACVSWRLTKSICFLVCSSALTTLLLRMSRSRKRSSIFLRSMSASLRAASEFSCIDLRSCFKPLRLDSSSAFSSSNVFAFFFNASCSFKVLSLSSPCFPSSSFFAFSCAFRSWFSWWYRLFRSLSRSSFS
mmetsp:Transcript_96653/g.189834  ORF Transcript_96653/g.189834 Transcript_96653/m.189834 type:complete len:212 (+) Transcript_96653:1124-1759(+)